jgi:hypothetical protein
MHEMTLDEMIACVEGDAKYWEECTPYVPENAEEMQCIARFLKRLKWLPIEDAPPTDIDNEVLLTGYAYGDPNKGRYVATGFCDQDGIWRSDTDSDELIQPTHYMPLDALPPVPKETTPNDN